MEGKFVAKRFVDPQPPRYIVQITAVSAEKLYALDSYACVWEYTIVCGWERLPDLPAEEK